MYRKLALAVLVASTAALGSITTPAHSDTLTGCPPSNVGSCSDAFFFTGFVNGSFFNGPTITAVESDLGTDGPGALSQVPANSQGVVITIDPTVAYIFTEKGTGTSSTALVSDIVHVIPSANTSLLEAISDPFEGLTVAGAEASHVVGGVTNFQVVEETGSPQSLTAFNPDLAIQFGSDVAAVPGPIAGAGLPGLIFAGSVLLVLARWR
jgi:hypothetical protein